MHLLNSSAKTGLREATIPPAHKCSTAATTPSRLPARRQAGSSPSAARVQTRTIMSSAAAMSGGRKCAGLQLSQRALHLLPQGTQIHRRRGSRLAVRADSGCFGGRGASTALLSPERRAAVSALARSAASASALMRCEGVRAPRPHLPEVRMRRNEARQDCAAGARLICCDSSQRFISDRPRPGFSYD